MKYMLDTNICIYIIKQRPENVIKKFLSCEQGDIGISSITMAELLYGVQKSQYPEKNQAAIDEFIAPLEIIDFGPEAAFQYGSIRANLEKKGTPIGSLDTLIAAHALSLKVILVTNNKKEFIRVPKLKVEDWVHR